MNLKSIKEKERVLGTGKVNRRQRGERGSWTESLFFIFEFVSCHFLEVENLGLKWAPHINNYWDLGLQPKKTL